MQYESPITSGKKVMAKVKVFFKNWSNFKVKVMRSYHVKGLVTRNTHVQY